MDVSAANGTVDVLRLLPAQQAHWELMRSCAIGSPGHSGHTVVDYRRLDGPIDHHLMMNAFHDVVGRQESLRLLFRSTGADPTMHVRADAEPSAVLVDLSTASETEQVDTLRRLLFDATRQEFDLIRGPLWWAWLVRLGPCHHWLVVCLSHIIADGWSSKVFMDDTLAAYSARIGARPPDRPAAASLAEIRDLQSARMRPSDESRRYWRSRLAVRPAVRGHPTTGTDRGDLLLYTDLPFRFTYEVADGLRRTAWRCRTTPFVTLMAAYHVQLAVATGKDRTTISTAAMIGLTDGEQATICQHAADPYISVTVTNDTTLREAVLLTHENMIASVRHLMPYLELARLVNPHFDGDRPWPDTHLYDGNMIDSAFSTEGVRVSGIEVTKPPFRYGPPPESHVPSLAWSRLALSSRPVWEVLCGPSLEINSSRDGGVLHHNADVMSATAMRRHLEEFLGTVETLLAEPDITVGDMRARRATRETSRVVRSVSARTEEAVR